MRRRMILLALMTMPSFVAAQGVVQPDPQAATQAAQQAATKADQALTAAQTAQSSADSKCAPLAAVPGMEMVGGSAGSGVKCRLVNAVQPRISRTAVCTLATVSLISSCDATWEGGSFPSETTIRLLGAPAPVSASQGTSTEQPIDCKAYNVTLSGVSVRCWTTQMLSINLAGVTAGLNLSPTAAAGAGTQIQVTAIPASQ